MPKTITEQIRYSVRPGDGGNIELVVEYDRVTLVEEEITYGELAGTIGHRPVPRTDTVTFDLHPQQAQMLLDDLQRTIEQQSWNRD
jgi:hypothetical protein